MWSAGSRFPPATLWALPGPTHNLIYELRIGSKSTDPQIALNGNSGLQFRESE